MVSEQFKAFANGALHKAKANPNAKTIEYVLNIAKMCVDQFKDYEYAKGISAECKRIIIEDIFNSDIYTILAHYDNLRANNKQSEEINMFWEILLFEARNMDLDSYLLYLEKNRETKDRFYLPKRKCFLKIGLVQALQDMLDDKLDILSISLPPGTGKTTFEKFFHSGLCGWFPKEYNLFFSHSAGITRMYYDGVLSILTDNIEYTWQEIFPELQVTSNNAKLEQINIGPYKPFQNLQTASVGSEMAGKVRASKFLLVDDMIGKIEEALNIKILDKLWNIYSTDARQRKVTGCKEIHIATRWSVHDIIGRLQRLYEGNKRCKFIAVPDIDPETNESNFAFDINGFTVEFFHDQELAMDEITYKCLYKNEPVEREGLLYTSEELRRYSSLPLREPDAILGICDVKNKGTDFMFLPCFYQYENDFYCVDCVCDDDSNYGRQYDKLTDIIIRNNMQQCEFESNSGGDRVSYEVNTRIEKLGARCNITDRPTETNKETRIIVNADWVKKHVLFKQKEDYSAKEDYGIMMSWLLCYTVVGKNEHDDVPDGFANFALFVTKGTKTAKVEAITNPFRTAMGGYGS